MEAKSYTKSIFASRLFWMGVAETIYGLINLVQDMLNGQTVEQEVVTLVLLGVATILLRIRTNQPVELSSW